MLLVVLGHSVAFWANQNWFDALAPVYDSDILFILSKFISHFHVYAFTLISGFIFCYVKKDRRGYTSLKELIKKKSKRLLIPYVCVLFLWVIPFYVVIYKPSIKTIILRFFLGTHVNQLWFLLMLFEVFLIAWLLVTYVKKLFWGFGIAILLYFIGIFCNFYVPNCFQVWKALQFVVFFFLGYVIYEKNIQAKSYRVVFCFFLDVAFFIVLLIIPMNRVLKEILELFSHLIGAVTAFFVLDRIVSICKKGVILRFIRDYSMGIYLLHQQLIWISLLIFNGKVPAISNAVINFIVGFSISTSIVFFLKKNKIGRIILGE